MFTNNVYEFDFRKYSAYIIDEIAIVKQGTAIWMSINGEFIYEIAMDRECCEYRYFTTDDELDYFVGCGVTKIVGNNAITRADTDDDDDVYEITFLNIYTTKGVMTFEAHNKHNGYYGGFTFTLEKIVDISGVHDFNRWGNYDFEKPLRIGESEITPTEITFKSEDFHAVIYGYDFVYNGMGKFNYDSRDIRQIYYNKRDAQLFIVTIHYVILVGGVVDRMEIVRTDRLERI